MKTKLNILGATGRQPDFWRVRNAKATLNGLRGEDGKPVVLHAAVAHILRSLQDIEAALFDGGQHPTRCTSCGLMIWDSQSIQVFGARFCMECGTALIEGESEDEGLREGLAADLARQAENGKYPSGLYHAHEKDHPFNPYWQRIVQTAPEVGKAWLDLRHRLTA